MIKHSKIFQEMNYGQRNRLISCNGNHLYANLKKRHKIQSRYVKVLLMLRKSK